MCDPMSDKSAWTLESRYVTVIILPLLHFHRKVLFRRFMIFQCIIMTQMLSIYLSPDNNSDKAFEEQIFMGIKVERLSII